MNRLLLLLALAWAAAPARSQTAVTTVSSATLVVGGGAVLDLNGGTLTFGADGTLNETGGGRVTGGLLTATRTLSAPSAVNVAGLGAVLTSSADLGLTTVIRGHMAQTGSGSESIARYYDIAPSTNSGLDATLAFTYDETELNGLDEELLELYRSADGGATWMRQGGSVDPSANTITLSGIDTFSRWTAGSTDAPLPVELARFDAVADGSSALLNWETAGETGNAGFDVEHEQADAWQRLGFLEGRGTTLQPAAYRFRTPDLTPGIHRFRLRQVDYDGTFAYSPLVEVTIALQGTHQLSPAHPNPFASRTSFTLVVQATQHVTAEVYDALGRRVAILNDEPVQADQVHRFTFDGTGLPAGTYLLHVRGGLFQQTHRMVLTK